MPCSQERSWSEQHPLCEYLVSMLEGLIKIAEEAGRAILEVREKHVRAKADGSPVTAADEAAHDLVVRELPRLSELPIVSEEDESGHSAAEGEFWLLDPLDGTKEFLKDSGEYTVNLALVSAGEPVLGIVHLPASDTTYYAQDGRAWVRKGASEPRAIRVKSPGATVRVAVSRDHITTEDEAIIGRFVGCDRRPAGSSLKLCLIAEGEADLYVRCGNTMEWDIAAAHAVLEAAGGRLRTLTGHPLRYGKPGLLNPGFVAAANEDLLARAVG